MARHPRTPSNRNGSPRLFSTRSRYRLKPREFAFRWADNRIIEETTGFTVPQSNTRYVIGRGLDPSDPPGTYYFDSEGKPSTTETHDRLCQWMSIVIFIEKGRLLATPRSRPATESLEEWSRYLHEHGLGLDRGASPWVGLESEQTARFRDDENGDEIAVEFGSNAGGDVSSDDEIERQLAEFTASRDAPLPLQMRKAATSRAGRDWSVVPRSAWFKAVLVRLSVLFDRSRDDSSIQKLAAYLCRTERWYEWWEDASLNPLRANLESHPEKVALLRALERVSYLRADVARGREIATKPIDFSFKFRGRVYRFRITKKRPNETERRFHLAVRALKALSSLKFVWNKRRRVSIEAFAAVTWLSRWFVQEPEAWARHVPTCRTVAEHFGVPPQRVRHVANRLTAHPMLGWLPIDKLLSKTPGRKPTPEYHRPGPATLLRSEVTRWPEGQAALRLLDEADQLEHGWKSSNDPNRRPPAPAQVGKARRLKKQAFDRLRALHEEMKRRR